MEFQAIQKKKKIYQTIIDQIKHSIAEGTIQPGDKLPSERALATMFKVSRTSVKEAMTCSGILWDYNCPARSRDVCEHGS